MEYTGGEKGPYPPGDALTTPSTGSVTREVHPAQYNVILTDRKQLDYECVSQRNQMTFPITVTKGGENKFTFVWEYPTPQELDLATEDKVTLTFLDADGNPVSDLWITVFPDDDHRPEPRQLVIGETDAFGRVYWVNYEESSFHGYALMTVSQGEEDQLYIYGAHPVAFTVTGSEEFTFLWVPRTDDPSPS
ncbi:MAG: YbfJ family protein [Oscillospiraceae bacterium]|nr:YbfJ family protein [Oscillospiraceae bacterium]